jgi:L-ribulose-5-phosphate 3-epimerase
MTKAETLSCFAVNTYSYTMQEDVRTTVRRLSGLGVREFELQMYPGHLWPAQIDKRARVELKAMLEDDGVSVSTLNMPNIDLNIAAATVEMRQMSMGVLRGVVQLAADIGAEGVVIGSGKANPLMPMPRPWLMDHFYTALQELVPLAESVGTEIYVENMPFAFLPRIDELLNALDNFGNPHIGVVYDVANGHFVKEDVGAALRASAKRLKIVHVSDTNQTVYRHDAVGMGTLDFTPIPGILREIGFARRPVLEIIAADADSDIEHSARELVAMGWGNHPNVA